MQLKVSASFIKTVSIDLLIFLVNCHRHYIADTQTLDTGHYCKPTYITQSSEQSYHYPVEVV